MGVRGFDLLNDARGVRVVFYRVVRGEHEVHRRYSDFVALHGGLQARYPAVLLPPLPPKHSLSRLLSKPWGYTEDTDIIGRRTRLLDNYLVGLAQIKPLEKCALIDAFYTQEDTLPRAMGKPKQSALLVSPDPWAWDSMNPYLPQLPIPPASYYKTYNGSGHVFGPIERHVRVLWSLVGKLEMATKSIRSDLDLWRRHLVDLGGFLNIMSMMEVSPKQRLIIERTGNKIDLSFLNIEVLQTSINKNVLELILSVKYSISEIVRVLHYRKLKEAQLGYLSLRISKMQSKLKTLVDSLVQSLILKTSHTIVESPSLSRALKTLNVGSDSEIVNIVDSNKETVSIIKSLNDELSQRQIPCYEALKKDVRFVNAYVEQQANAEIARLLSLLASATDNWQTAWSNFNTAQVKVWTDD